MNNLQTLILATLLAMPLKGTAQTEALPYYKGLSDGNPISSNVFCADPTALEYNGRLYVYGSNDSQQFIANKKKGENGYGAIKSIVVFSTDDLLNWTFHGTIDVGKLCSYCGNSWAPSVTWRTNAQGKDEFFLYFANGASNVGVLKADTPIGPWKSPRTSPLVNHGMSGVDPCNWLFDPGVVVTDDGEAWIAFGGGDPNNQGNDLQPNNARIAKLKSSMTAIDGSAVKLPAPYHFEASELNIIGGKFVYTYCSSWRGRNDWSKYQKEKGITVGAPGTCTMCYMVTDNPKDPNSWEYRDAYGPHPGTSDNNHSHLQKFQGTYYHIYHSGALLQAMKNGKGVDSSARMYRSICINKASVNEETVKIGKVTLNNTGATNIKNLDPYQLQQAETMANSGGVNYEDFTNISKPTSISGLGNDASRNLQVKMAPGAWTMMRKVDFGNDGAQSFTIRLKGTGTVELRWGSKAAAKASLDFSTTAYKDFTIPVDPTQFKGVRNLYIVFPNATNVYFDTWQFWRDDMTAVKTVNKESKADGRIYDLSGRRIDKDAKRQGIYIKNGKKVIVK